jgi:hypothetical protein
MRTTWFFTVLKDFRNDATVSKMIVGLWGRRSLSKYCIEGLLNKCYLSTIYTSTKVKSDLAMLSTYTNDVGDGYVMLSSGEF